MKKLPTTSQLRRIVIYKEQNLEVHLVNVQHRSTRVRYITYKKNKNSKMKEIIWTGFSYLINNFEIFQFVCL